MDPSQEPILRVSNFVVVLVGMSVWELIVPARAATVKRLTRRSANLALMILNAGLLRLFMPLSLVGVAVFAERAGLGLFRYLRLSPWDSNLRRIRAEPAKLTALASFAKDTALQMRCIRDALAVSICHR